MAPSLPKCSAQPKICHVTDDKVSIKKDNDDEKKKNINFRWTQPDLRKLDIRYGQWSCNHTDALGSKTKMIRVFISNPAHLRRPALSHEMKKWKYKKKQVREKTVGSVIGDEGKSENEGTENGTVFEMFFFFFFWVVSDNLLGAFKESGACGNASLDSDLILSPTLGIGYACWERFQTTSTTWKWLQVSLKAALEPSKSSISQKPRGARSPLALARNPHLHFKSSDDLLSAGAPRCCSFMCKELPVEHLNNQPKGKMSLH